MSNNRIVAKGLVIDALPELKFRVRLEDGKEILAYTGGKMKLNKIKVLIGDKVQVELDPYGGKATNRLVRRL